MDTIMVIVVKVQGISLHEAMTANPESLQSEIKNIQQMFPNLGGLDFSHWTVNLLMEDALLKYVPVNLQFLNLSGCRKISDESFKFMPSVLTHLNLTNCFKISDSGLKGLPSGLIRLNLTNCFKITDEGVSFLPSSLQSLEVTRCFKVKKPWRSTQDVAKEDLREMKRKQDTERRKRVKEQMDMKKLEQDIKKEEARLTKEDEIERKKKQEEERKARIEEEIRLKREEEEYRIAQRLVEQEKERKKKEEEEEAMRKLELEIAEEERMLNEEEERAKSATEAAIVNSPPTEGKTIEDDEPRDNAPLVELEKLLQRTEKRMSMKNGLLKLKKVDRMSLSMGVFAEDLKRFQENNVTADVQAKRMQRKHLSMDLFQPPEKNISEQNQGKKNIEEDCYTLKRSDPVIIPVPNENDQKYLDSLKSLIEESKTSENYTETIESPCRVEEGVKGVDGIKINEDLEQRTQQEAQIQKTDDDEKISPKKPQKLGIRLSDVAELASKKRQKRKMHEKKKSVLLRELQQEHMEKLDDQHHKLEIEELRLGVNERDDPRKWRQWKVRLESYKDQRKNDSFGDSFDAFITRQGVIVKTTEKDILSSVSSG